ncbi:hypothetical protein BDP27DRAFT_273277 [Rhodocollybia butyracea]|uniref:Uncharacterized protein n=1 Tax=Rhodocollybia butyracea TaxID=206335 RepID=A0A9P5PIP9_9AGAR|nr:hypothetical protein BDP27DRAFT_273277 [Rhodocollybia butyracea]
MNTHGADALMVHFSIPGAIVYWRSHIQHGVVEPYRLATVIHDALLPTCRLSIGPRCMLTKFLEISPVKQRISFLLKLVRRLWFVFNLR